MSGKSRVIEHNKLVRDNIPKILDSDKSVIDYKIHIAQSSAELIKYVVDKLIEEATELKNSVDKNGNMDITEVADVYEIFQKLMHEVPYSHEEIMEAVNDKADRNGKFDFNLILKSVEKEK